MKLLTSFILATTLSTIALSSALADTDFNKLRHDPMAAMAAGDAMSLETIPRAELEEVRGEGWFKLTVKIIDNIGRVMTTYEVWKFVWGNPSYSTCVYSGTANSTPMYCY